MPLNISTYCIKLCTYYINSYRIHVLLVLIVYFFLFFSRTAGQVNDNTEVGTALIESLAENDRIIEAKEEIEKDRDTKAKELDAALKKISQLEADKKRLALSAKAKGLEEKAKMTKERDAVALKRDAALSELASALDKIKEYEEKLARKQ